MIIDNQGKIPEFPWEKDLPYACRNCSNIRYISSLCYLVHERRQEIERLTSEVVRQRGLIDAIYDIVRDMSRDNQRALQASISAIKPVKKEVRV